LIRYSASSPPLLISLPPMLYSMSPLPPSSTLFPYTTLFRSQRYIESQHQIGSRWGEISRSGQYSAGDGSAERKRFDAAKRTGTRDRKSTRLNSSHVKTRNPASAWKKKKKTKQPVPRPMTKTR